MQIYSVMLEGVDAGLGYFMNIEVAAFDPAAAVGLAKERAQELGLTILGVEEVTETRQTSTREAKVLSVSGKSYFPSED
jgi:hypothetical protein